MAHHEKWDGSGYPGQLSGEDIPLAARIFSVADVFDALCSKRPYKEALDFKTVMAILEKDTGRHFDTTVMAVFQPLAEPFYNLLFTSHEVNASQLLEDRIRIHFGV